MTNATNIIETTRRATAALVDREERRTGSRMTAYKVVASRVGASSSWIRMFIGRRPDLRPDLVVGFNILRTAYDSVCTRVEQEAENERSRAAALRAEIHAATSGIMGVVAGEMRDPPTPTSDAFNSQGDG